MKLLPLAAAMAAAFLLIGCEDITDSISNGGLPVYGEPQVRTFAAPPRAVYQAALGAIAQMDYHFVKGGPAQGELQAVGRVLPGDDPGTAHQFTLKADFQATLDGGGTEVTVSMNEILEADSEHHPGQGTATPLRDTSLPQVFFDYVAQGLKAPPANKG